MLLGKQSLCIVRVMRNTQIHTVDRMQNFNVSKRVVRIATIGLERVNSMIQSSMFSGSTFKYIVVYSSNSVRVNSHCLCVSLYIFFSFLKDIWTRSFILHSWFASQKTGIIIHCVCWNAVYIPAATKVSNPQETPLRILCPALWSTVFTVLFWKVSLWKISNKNCHLTLRTHLWYRIWPKYLSNGVWCTLRSPCMNILFMDQCGW
jgi:hypothetical protein